jgi:hypothetical protein
MSERQPDRADRGADQWLEPGTVGDDRPLPPLPDGGLAATMPAWLRAAPAASELALPTHGLPAGRAEGEIPHSSSSIRPGSIDPTRFVEDADFPVWLRGLAGSASGSTERIEEHHELEPAALTPRAARHSVLGSGAIAQPAPGDEEPATPFPVDQPRVAPRPARRRDGDWVPVVLALVLVAVAALAVALATGILS